MAIKSRRPYLVRAIYEWAVENSLTPYVVVAADYPGVAVPRQHVQDNRITLNLSPMAVQTLHLDQEPMWFSARFGGRAFDVIMPSGAILAVFARENGEGMIFGDVEPAVDSATGITASAAPNADTPDTNGTGGSNGPSDPKPNSPKPRSRSHLTVVK